MKTHQDYIKEMESFGESFVKTNTVKPRSSHKKGTLERMSSYLNDYQRKLEKAKTEIPKKANSILKEAESNPHIDDESLKNDMTITCQNILRDLVAKANKAFK